MNFADPHACPRCRGTINGDSRCRNCGLDLTSEAVRRLWQVLLQADALLAEASRAARIPVREPAPPQATGQLHTPYPSYPAPPQATAPAPAPAPQGPGSAPHTAAPSERSWSVGTVLLVLGAFGLIVAGFIFVTRSWGDLELLGRTLILSGLTGVIGGLGVWVTRRTLRASAEAVWTVFLALLTLDFFAARHEGMLGHLEIAWSWLVWGAFLLGLSVGIARAAKRHVKTALLAPSLIGAVGIAIAGIGAGGVGADWDTSWRSFAALVVSGLLALAARPAKLRATTIGSRVVVAGFYLFAYVVSFVELVNHPGLDQLIGDGHGVPMLLVAIAAFVVADVVRPVRLPAVALAVVAASALVITPAVDGRWPEGLWLGVAALAVVFGVGARRGTSAWTRGVRLGAGPVILGLGVVLIVWLFDVLYVAGNALDRSWTGSWDARLTPQWADHTARWPVPVVVIAAVVVAWFVARWPEIAKAAPKAKSAVVIVAGLGLVDAVVISRLPLWLAVAVLLVAAALLLVFHDRVPDVLNGPTIAVLVVIAAVLAIPSAGVSAAAWIGGALLLATLVRNDGPAWLRMTYAAGAALLMAAGAAATVDVMDVDRSVTFFVVLIVTLALVAAAALLLPQHVARLPVEVVGGLGTIVALVGTGSTPELAVRWTIAGVALIALSFVVDDRRWYVWPGLAALVVAYILLIVDSGFSFIEAYTLPLGAALLAAGLFLLRRHETSSTWLYLGPGLALALLPSVPQALAEPTGLRALLLGIAALVALALGVRLGWQAPFVVGVTIVALLVLFNIGPYANAAPRVVLIAVVSALLLGVGITWEDRVRDSRLLVKYVRSMR